MYKLILTGIFFLCVTTVNAADFVEYNYSELAKKLGDKPAVLKTRDGHIRLFDNGSDNPWCLCYPKCNCNPCKCGPKNGPRVKQYYYYRNPRVREYRYHRVPRHYQRSSIDNYQFHPRNWRSQPHRYRTPKPGDRDYFPFVS